MIMRGSGGAGGVTERCDKNICKEPWIEFLGREICMDTLTLTEPMSAFRDGGIGKSNKRWSGFRCQNLSESRQIQRGPK